MIIQCEQCKTKFRLDDSKVTPKGVKVRCAKCRSVFTVMPPEQPEELFAAPLEPGASLDEAQQQEASAAAPGSENWDELFAAAAAQQDADAAAAPAEAPTGDMADAFAAAEEPAPAVAPAEPADFGSFSFDDAGATPAATPETLPEEAPQTSDADFNPFATAAAPAEQAQGGSAAPSAAEEPPSFGFDAEDAFADAFKHAAEAPAPEPPLAQPDATEFSFEADDTFADAFKPAAETATPEAPPAAPGSEFSFSFDTEESPFGAPTPAAPAAEAAPEAAGDFDFAAFGADQQASPEGQAPPEPQAREDFSFGDDNPFAETAAPAAPAATGQEGGAPEATGESEFSFGDPFAVPAETPPGPSLSAAEPESTSGLSFEDPFAPPAGAAPEAPSFTADAEKVPDLAFGDENPFADMPLSSTAAAETAEQGIDFETLDFSAGKEEAAPAFGVPEQPEAPEAFGTPSAPAAPGDEAAVEASDDFFDALKTIAPPGKEVEPAAPEVPPAAASESSESPVAAPAPEMAVPAQSATVPAAGEQLSQEDLPPLSIASRRKGSPLLKILLAVLGVVVAAAVGFFAWLQMGEEKAKPVQEAERISIRGVNAAFVKNPGGELLVVSGEAVNNYKKPRAAIQIKGMVFGPGGQVLKSKNAYAGNPLTTEQLATMPMDKIEAAMANQFGDSLSNLEVAPGKAIPFAIVIPQPPADARDYGVEAAGSTVATGKQ